MEVIMRRYIITGAPGAGKTTVLAALRQRGFRVVDEAATDIIAREHALGRVESWRDPGFIDAITLLQRERQEAPIPATSLPPTRAVQLFDRSPLCTLALARYAGQPPSPILASEVDRVIAERIYQPQVFFVRLLGFITPTAARRISLADSIRFERIHEQVYREHGFELVDIPVATIEQRVDLIDRYTALWRRFSSSTNARTRAD
jgi:predicted ATPase